VRITVDLSGSILQTCDLCRARERCFPLCDDSQVHKRFCVGCISRLLWACQPQTPRAARPVAIPVRGSPPIREGGFACGEDPHAVAGAYGGAPARLPA
jgi:hypothetical protein